jgi:hypothetical protein
MERINRRFQLNNIKSQDAGRKHVQIHDKLQLRHRFWEIAAATIEDLAFGIRFSRGVHAVDRRVCLSRASYAAAEKSEWRMALKI